MVDSALKQRVLGALEQLPPEATLEDLIENLLFQAKIDRGLADVAAGRVTPHEEVVARFVEKLKK
jgi:predicted transcriptional regulator